MSELASPSFAWLPGLGPDPRALDRMAEAFPKPADPMGEAWFMGVEREMFPQLSGDLSALPDDDIIRSLEEITSGSSAFGLLPEWTRWYHYLMPRLLSRQWRRTFYQPAELLFSAHMMQHPGDEAEPPYPKFRTDALITLGRYIMSPVFWPDGRFDAVHCLSKWTGPNGIARWGDANNLLSASLFFSVKYLPPHAIERWFRSVLDIADLSWRSQIVTWLTGAQPMLTGDIAAPSELSNKDQPQVDWTWSHVIRAGGTFLPAENRASILAIARELDVDAYLGSIWSDPATEAVAAETTWLPAAFTSRYKRTVA